MDRKKFLERALSEVVPFVMERWCSTGGFGFAPSLPASVEDTYHAIEILEKSKMESPLETFPVRANRELRSFLLREVDRDAWRPVTVYQFLALCSSCDVEPDRSWLSRFQQRVQRGSLSLEERYYLARIRRELPYLTLLGKENESPSGEEMEWGNAEELWMCLYLNAGSVAGFDASKSVLIDWLQSCRNPDGGFGPTPGASSFIEHCHWCLASLVILGGEIPSPAASADFVLACRTRRGGFSRKNGAAPSLDATWHAVESLYLLKGAI